MPDPQPQNQTPQTLAQMVRAKNPGAYDDMDDATLEQKVLAKYPQYGDLPRTQVKGSPISDPSQIGPRPSGVLPWFQDLQSDIKYGTGNTLPGRIMKSMGAQGVDVGSQAGAPGEYVASPVLGVARAAGGVARLPWQPQQGLKDIAGGAWQASQIPMSIGSPMAAELAAVRAAQGAEEAAPAATGAGNWLASKLRYPATARQSQMGRPGTVKNVLPTFLQKYTVPEGLIPKGELGTPTNPGQFAELPVRVKPPTPELGTPENPGWVAKLPNRMPAQQPEPSIASPSTGEPLFSGSEGRAATWTNSDVMRLAQQGNREAIQQAVRRGLQLPENARYVMGSADYPRAVYNPRETTTFDPEGTPIRNKANPKLGQGSPNKRILLPWTPQQ